MGRKATVIGPLPRQMEGTIKALGFTITRSVKSIPSNGKIAQSDIIIIVPNKGSNYTPLLRSTKSITKLVIMQDQKSPAARWLREPFCHVLVDPSLTDLTTYMTRLIKEASCIKRTADVEHQMALMREELSFFENMNRNVTSKTTVDDLMSTTAKWAKKALGAEAWAILMMDEQTEKLTQARASLNLKKFECACNETGTISRTAAKRKKPQLIAGKSGRAMAKKCACKPSSIISVPVSGKNGVYGVLEVLNLKPSALPFTQRDTELLGKLAGHVAIAIEKIKLQQKLEDLVVTDDLTNLFNTRYLNRSIESEIARSERYGLSVSLIFMDIDHFKDINDNFGHLVGSKLLVEVGQILIRELRNIDVVARYGGDEFVLVLPQTTLTNAINIAERLRKAIARAPFLASEGLSLKLTASFGVAAYPDSAKSKEELLRLADESMYRVKNRTRNGVYAII